MFGIEVTGQDLMLVGFLVFLEGILSIDNALVLAMLCRPLPPEQRRKALTYGIWGAIVFRLLALVFITQLIRFPWVKILGGAYLLFVSIKELTKKEDEGLHINKKPVGFWRTVMMVELMDIAFAVDSILAAAALSQKVWVLFLGGIIGIVMMRYAAGVFIKLLDRFPGFAKTAYFLILIVGLKLVIDGLEIPGIDFGHYDQPAFWLFWGCMLAAILYGFFSHDTKKSTEDERRALKKHDKLTDEMD